MALTAAVVNPLGFGAMAVAQAANPAPAGTAKMLYIDVLEGEGELNDIRARTAREPVVQVKDENHKPVAGALVLFSVHASGAQPVAAFSGLPTFSVRTGADGIARAQGYGPQHAGSVQILVTATLGAVAAEVTIHQTNYAPGGRLQRTLTTHKALVGAMSELAAFAVASSIVVVKAQNSQTPAVITAGTGTVAATRGAHPSK